MHRRHRHSPAVQQNHRTYGLNPHGQAQGMICPAGYFAIEDIKASLQALVDQGAQVQLDVNDVRGGTLTAITDGDGSPIGLIQSP
jgi:predicted enzyme related to lactoylglutathione lyase